MNSKTKLMNPATMAALLFLAAAISTAPAMADDYITDEANEVSPAQIEEASKEQARQANEAAVEEAARAVEADIRLDLDINLIGHTSLLIAGDM
jgi:hypothetical protein